MLLSVLMHCEWMRSVLDISGLLWKLYKHCHPEPQNPDLRKLKLNQLFRLTEVKLFTNVHLF